jgi:hypothetical protein
VLSPTSRKEIPSKPGIALAISLAGILDSRVSLKITIIPCLAGGRSLTARLLLSGAEKAIIQHCRAVRKRDHDNTSIEWHTISILLHSEALASSSGQATLYPRHKKGHSSSAAATVTATIYAK